MQRTCSSPLSPLPDPLLLLLTLGPIMCLHSAPSPGRIPTGWGGRRKHPSGLIWKEHLAPSQETLLAMVGDQECSQRCYDSTWTLGWALPSDSEQGTEEHLASLLAAQVRRQRPDPTGPSLCGSKPGCCLRAGDEDLMMFMTGDGRDGRHEGGDWKDGRAQDASPWVGNTRWLRT